MSFDPKRHRAPPDYPSDRSIAVHSAVPVKGWEAMNRDESKPVVHQIAHKERKVAIALRMIKERRAKRGTGPPRLMPT
jgi:hypothetical protein